MPTHVNCSHDGSDCFFCSLSKKKEPTSALDAATSDTVEKYILDEVKNSNGKLKSVVWITHAVEQAKRVGTRFLRITARGIHEESGIQDV